VASLWSGDTLGLALGLVLGLALEFALLFISAVEQAVSASAITRTSAQMVRLRFIFVFLLI
jgi:hypothetical protein